MRVAEYKKAQRSDGQTRGPSHRHPKLAADVAGGSVQASQTLRSSVEGLQLVRLDGRLVLVQVRQGVLRAVVVRVVVRVDGLRLEARDGVELLDGGRTQTRQRAEDRALDLSDLSVLHRVHERVLRLGRVVLELLRRVLLAEGRDLVEVHLQVVRHLL